MKVLLNQKVDKLGDIGDIVDVADGYGRNYLLPQQIAVPVTEENIRRLERQKQRLLAQERERREALQAKADAIAGRAVTISMQASDEGQLYGSVTPAIIADAYQQEGIEAEARWFLLDDSIKELGVYDVRCRVHPDVEVQAKVWVVEARAD